MAEIKSNLADFQRATSITGGDTTYFNILFSVLIVFEIFGSGRGDWNFNLKKIVEI